VISFIKQARESGVGTFRVFDALNDERNLMIPLLACKASGIQTEAALSYTVSPVHTPNILSAMPESCARWARIELPSRIWQAS
jgi:pyruvate/oxaloacetate carboxyltransferase